MVEGRRGPRIVEAAAAWAADEDISTGYMYSGWCQTALPHRRPPDNSTIWKLETDSMTLLVEPGVRMLPSGEPAYVGVPFGAIPPSAHLDLLAIGGAPHRQQGRGAGRQPACISGAAADLLGGRRPCLVREQAERISRCRLTFHAARRGATILVNQNIVWPCSWTAQILQRTRKPVRRDSTS